MAGPSDEFGRRRAHAGQLFLPRKLSAGFFYGETTLRREVAGLVFAESVYRENVIRHEHENAFFNLVIAALTQPGPGRGPRAVTLAPHPCGGCT